MASYLLHVPLVRFLSLWSHCELITCSLIACSTIDESEVNSLRQTATASPPSSNYCLEGKGVVNDMKN